MPHPTHAGRKSQWRSASALAALLVCALLILLGLRYEAEPIARGRIVESLESRLHCSVELDEVHLSLSHGLELTGAGLRIAAIGNHERLVPGGVPMLSVRSFQFATTFADLLLHRRSAITAYAQGLVLTIPASNDRERLDQTNPRRRDQPRDSFFLNKLVVTDSRLVLELPILKAASEARGFPVPSKDPVVFELRKLILVDPGKNLPFVYEALLTNPKPIGEVHSTGHVGPWVFNDSRQTPVDGNYTFDHADLSTVNGIAGTLSSQGRVTGVLGRMGVQGTTDTPDFALDISAHPFPVRTEFQALVDGTTGNVALEDVAARFLHTSVQGNGLISRASNAQTRETGHQIALDVHLKEGRAEDLLTLFSKSPVPLLRAAISLTGHLDVPPGKQRLVLKLHARGGASITNAMWSNPALQKKVDALSMRAEDRARELKEHPSALVSAASSMNGAFIIQRGSIDISGLVYKMPGVTVLMAGAYPLVGRELDFHGIARTAASAAQMETGIKSLLLKPISPFLKKNGAGMQIPVSFTGDKSHPAFALDLKHHALDEQFTQGVHAKPQL